MHWLVEVSRVGDTVASERYCIDARRWQSALQEARRLRGDSGALPKLTIELTDNGYRAVDPKLKVRYVVSEAPPSMPLTDGARAILSTAPPPVVESGPATSPSAAPAPSAEPSAPAASVPASPLPSAEPMPTASVAAASPFNAAPAPIPSAAPAPTPAVAPAPVPSVPAATAPSAPPVLSNSSAPPLAQPSEGSSPPRGSIPPAQVIRQREERPTEANPIAYRELAMAVKPGAARADVEALLLAKLAELKGHLSADTRRYVQLAVFDHVFVKRPVRPPLGTLQWKDWRGEPVLSFPGYDDGSEAPPPSSISTSRMPSWSPGMMTSVAPVGASVLPAPAPRASVAPVPAPVPSVPPPVSVSPSEAPRPASLIPARVVSVGASVPASARVSSSAVVASAAPVSSDAAPAVLEASPLALVTVLGPADAVGVEPLRVAEAPPASEPSVEVVGRPEPSEVPPTRRSEPPSHGRSDPKSSRRSDPYVARRRAPDEDLIGDLFERMHELTFMPDIVSGAEFVVRVLGDLIPCEATLVHVFDLGRREFVVVRARGPSPSSALMFRTPDLDPFVLEVMRRPSMLPNGSAPRHSGAFTALGVPAKFVLARGVRQGGRYLGMIELGNPLGGSAFHEGEVNALEYVCEQFAEFVASRPVVLDEDLVRG